jgi:forkhead protein FKH
MRMAYRGGRGGHRGSSTPSSPNQLNYITQGPKDMAARDPASTRKRKASPAGSPPPSSAVSRPHETPDRKPARGLRKLGEEADDSPLPGTRKQVPETLPHHSAHPPQSPTLTSSYPQEEGISFVTPAPHRVHPKLAPPSTAQRPSQHMPTSSPAPFWKYADIGSTPLKPTVPFDASPSKHNDGVLDSSSPHAGTRSPATSPPRPRAPDTKEAPNITDEEDEHGFDLAK